MHATTTIGIAREALETRATTPRAWCGPASIGALTVWYGARFTHRCDIGAFFNGVASGSLHGWVWFAAAFAGNIMDTHLMRPLFGLRVELRSASCV